MSHNEFEDDRSESERFEQWAEGVIDGQKRQISKLQADLLAETSMREELSERVALVREQRDIARELRDIEKATRLELGRYLVRLRKLAEDVRNEPDPLARALKANALVSDTLNVARALGSTALDVEDTCAGLPLGSRINTLIGGVR